jgi:two-component system NtrC family sensor kinase
VTASLDLQETIRVILEEARSVLGVASCGLSTLDAASGELRTIASLDLPKTIAFQIRIRAGEGIGGRAVSELAPVQSADLWNDPRVQFPELPRASGLRSMLAAPLAVGGRAVGAITVFRREAYTFSPAEEKLLLAFADQAAIALEHARLYADLEAMVAERTREVEVILETLPLAVFVLDTALRVVRANIEAARALDVEAPGGRPLTALLPADRATPVLAVVREAFVDRRISRGEMEVAIGGHGKTFRLTAAPIQPAHRLAGPQHVVLLMEDITLAKRVERQMLLTERLTTAGRLAAGVAHELNNPLATIAGCAESLLARSREDPLAARPEMDDFRRYLGIIEEEAYRCRDITSGLLQLTREPGRHRTPVDLNAVVARAVDLLSHQSRFAGRHFATELGPDLPAVVGNEGQLLQVFLGIGANALEAMSGGGALRIRLGCRRGEVEVEFEDEGPGIPDEILPRIFDPFFTTKPPGQGTGLGLAIAQGIITDHGGRIEVTSRVGKGSIFRVVLPA